MSKIRYSFANAKQVHIDMYKTLISDAINNGDTRPYEEICSRALRICDTAVETLQNEGRVGHAD